MTVLPGDQNFARESLRLTRVPDAELARLGRECRAKSTRHRMHYVTMLANAGRRSLTTMALESTQRGGLPIVLVRTPRVVATHR